MKIYKVDALVNLMILCALTEEYQVVSTIMGSLANLREEKDGLRVYSYLTSSGIEMSIGVASANLQGASTMSAVAARQFERYKPSCAALIGIAAAVDTDELSLGDVPFANQVVGTDDMSIADGVLTFRTEGFQCDSRVRTAFGALRSDVNRYEAWQIDCLINLPILISELNILRRIQITQPTGLAAPHILGGTVAGTPFLIRDSNFRDDLRKSKPEAANYRKIQVSQPLHPKLLSTEMESHGFMRAASEAQVPAVVLKGISDDGDENKSELEKETGGFYRAFACSNALRALLFSLETNPFSISEESINPKNAFE